MQVLEAVSAQGWVPAWVQVLAQRSARVLALGWVPVLGLEWVLALVPVLARA